MRLVTWNVWWRFGDDWERRQPAIAATLRRLRPDLVGLQETWADQVDRLGEQLGMHAAEVETTIPPPPEYELGVGLLSRWPIAAVDEHLLPAQHRPPPPAMVATVDHPGGPLRVIVACTEWEQEYADDHRAQTTVLATLAADGPTVLLADLNAPPGSSLLEPLDRAMVDAYAAGGGDPDAVTLSSSLPFAPLEASHLIDRRIDHVFVRGLTPEGAFVADAAVGGVQPSDHYAVVADVSRSG
jgi:endonuclease/exonuclease/phosphatase family metal-dependent hydrolase